MGGRLLRLAGALALALGMLPATVAHAASTLDVPSAYPTIQSAINAAANGDTVVVAPGTYYENLDFAGKAITVESSGGSASTFIDGSGTGTVVSFHSGEGRGSVLQGFTIQHGYANLGGGIYISGASPTIQNDYIGLDHACSGGGGIYANSSSVLITDNQFVSNVGSFNCSGGRGGAVELSGAGQAVVTGNSFQENIADDGGAMELFAAGSPLIEDNTFSGNSGTYTGGAIEMLNDTDGGIVQNIFRGDLSPEGSSIYYLTPSGSTGPTLTNDTIDDNAGPAVYAAGFDAQSRFANDIIEVASGTAALYCDGTYNTAPPVIDGVDAYNAGGGGFGGTCATPSAAGFSADPLLTTDGHLNAGSPAIDQGDNSAPGLPATDLDGKTRIIGPAVDLGAYEYGTLAPAAALTPVSADLGNVPGGSTSTTIFTLSNTGNVALSVSGDTFTGSTLNHFSKTGDTCAGQTLAYGAACSITVSFYAGAPGTFSASLSVSDTAGTQNATVTATGSMGRPSFNPTSLAFGSDKVNHQTGSKTVTVTNVGNAALQVFTVSIKGTNPGDFKITSNSCSNHTLAVGGKCSISVAFKALALGTRTAYIDFPCNDAVPDYTVQLSGTGTK